jgi:outer membrane protein OmpA-like peptidoglycan-associated protein/Tol biopolymer transport system component
MQAQGYHSDSKRAIRKFEEAVDAYRAIDYVSAEQALKKAIQADDQFVEAYHLLSQVCYDSGRLEEAISHYSRSIEIDPEGNPDGYRLLGGLVLKTGDYTRCLELVETFLSFPPEAVTYRETGIAMRQNCLYALEAIANPVPFRPVNLGDSVNSGMSEYWPSLSVDESLLIFTVMVPVESSGTVSPGYVQEDFYYSVRSGEGWGRREDAGPPLNTPDNEGAHTMTADGRQLYFTACNRRDGMGQCDIYVSGLVKGGWSTPVNLGQPVNSPYSEKHPTISADGRMLIFASNRPGGKGSYDLWMSVRKGRGWSPPVNLGDSVNTTQLEQSPFLHPDQRSLYFSSNGWTGMGEGDLFYSRLGPDRSWSAPRNLGFPVNTFHDEIGLSVNAAGNRAYFASDREGRGDTDLYTFDLPQEVRPVEVSYLSGRIYDSRNMKGIQAIVQLIELETGEVVMETLSLPGEGDYLVSLPTDRDYALNVSAEDYLFYSAHFAFSGQHSRTNPYRRDIPLERITIGSRVVLNNVFFSTGSHSLLPASVAELERVMEFLDENPSLSVEIGGHTDSTGTPDSNLLLSERRADAVVAYLTARGIENDRLIPAGYGDTRPVADNRTEEGRALNRRTELTIRATR